MSQLRVRGNKLSMYRVVDYTMTSHGSYEELFAALNNLQPTDATSIASFRGRNFTLDGKAEEIDLAGQEYDPREDILMILTDDYLEAFLPLF